MKIFKTINLKSFGEKYQGKVRDYYIVDNPPSHKATGGQRRILITTDRISAFDVILGYIPHKGQVLNQLSEFWFKQTKDIIQNHMISTPDPNVMLVKNCKIIPIEMVVRGYITGVTGTSIWGSYKKGERIVYGIKFPEGLSKNQKLPKPAITPTTKAHSTSLRAGSAVHDERLTEKEILQGKTRLPDGQVVSPKIWREMKKAALKLFERGTKICAKSGIILVDTKYEFGLDKNNKLMLIDEIHTPDSSRFWIKKTYKKLFEKGEEPENFDKEFLRLWFKKRGYTGDGKMPKMPDSFINIVSKRYIKAYEMITGKKFFILRKPIAERIEKNLLKIISV